MPPKSTSAFVPRPFARATLRTDLPASFVVFFVAVPLSLGVALASNAPLMAGLIAGVVGGIVAGLVGGSPLQVSGPAAGLTVIVADLVTRFGWPTTALITAAAGLLQIGFGLSRLARFASAIPPSVVHGMLAGIGLTIALSQAHVVLGGQPRTGAWASLLELPGQLAGWHDHAVLVGAVTIGVILVWGRLPRRLRVVPGALVGVLAATVLAGFWLDVPLVRLPSGLLEALRLPTFAVAGDQWFGVAVGVVTIALVASVESLLAEVAVDRMHSGPRTDPNRELVGQGTANTLSGLLGGLPVAGVIVRSSTNAAAGARTKASAILHGLWIALFSIALVGLIEKVPLAALAGLLVVVGLQLVKLTDIRTALEHGELPIYLVTALGVLFLNLLEGVGLGLVLAGVLALFRVAHARLRLEPGSTYLLVVEGTLSFLAVPKLSATLARIPADVPVRIELVADYLDHAAYDHLQTWTQRRRRAGGLVEVIEPGRAEAAEHLRWPFATWSQWQTRGQTSGKTHQPGAAKSSLIAGVNAFHTETADRLSPVLRELADRQQPSGVLITCADSRVEPSFITHSGPGDLFTVRNVGNLATGVSTAAAVQFATSVLDVPMIAVCGHTGCGAMGDLLAHRDSGDWPDGPLGEWLRSAGRRSLDAYLAGHPVGVAALADGRSEVDALAMVNIAVQLDALRAEEAAADLVGLFFDIPTATMLLLDEPNHRFTQPDRPPSPSASTTGCTV